ncbi:RICIN domain-containing protein [Streptomyces xanthophaeus]|uniref:RICIN domain-containing protein n=1 Tax=Streptomyces xanthophaeus TaxID=67385 RepID=UPI000690AC49|nr:RICIN domain-containing protein [Streptomyces xanthophaeus]WST20630.1 RICIN domain-containing protein [Streptomyces xanthophaeus]WST64383.1 RICIN domain-containing protein [Streptomyces xanthophaeus]
MVLTKRTSLRTALVALIAVAGTTLLPTTAAEARTGTAPAGQTASDLGIQLAPNQLWELRKRGSRYEIANYHSGMCLKVKSGSNDSGAPVVQAECGTASEQLWKAEVTDGGSFIQLRNANSGKCLDISGGVARRGAKLIQWDCSGALNQKWWDTDNITGDRGYWISATTPSGSPTWMCLDMPGLSTSSGTQAAMWECS